LTAYGNVNVETKFPWISDCYTTKNNQNQWVELKEEKTEEKEGWGWTILGFVPLIGNACNLARNIKKGNKKMAVVNGVFLTLEVFSWGSWACGRSIASSAASASEKAIEKVALYGEKLCIYEKAADYVEKAKKVSDNLSWVQRFTGSGDKAVDKAVRIAAIAPQVAKKVNFYTNKVAQWETVVHTLQAVQASSKTCAALAPVLNVTSVATSGITGCVIKVNEREYVNFANQPVNKK